MTIKELYEKQMELSPKIKANFDALNFLEKKQIKIGNRKYTIQFNPERIKSSAADIKKEVKKNNCFLCKENLWENQIGMNLGNGFTIRINPMPIVKYHFTIICNEHIPQQFAGYENHFLEFAKVMKGFTVFFNGSKCGASAPFHLHFQACLSKELNLWSDLPKLEKKNVFNAFEIEDFSLKFISDKQGKGFVLITCQNQQAAHQALKKSISSLGQDMVNIGAIYEDDTFKIIIFPRKNHRPKEYYEEDESKKFLISPGFIDLMGNITCARKEDFIKIKKENIISIFKQI